MLRLVVCDLDGTLLPAGDTRLPDTVMEEFGRLTDHGVCCAVASGRAYSELKTLFAPIFHRMVFIAHDGALMMQRHCCLYKKGMDRRAAAAFLTGATGAADGGVALFGREYVYTLRAQSAFSSAMRERYRSAHREIDAPEELPDELLKIGLYRMKPAADKPSALRVAYQNADWTEYCDAGADKGKALGVLQQKFGITPAQTVVFGDNENDRPLFAGAETRFAMAGADPAIRRAAGQVTEDVVKTLQSLF